MLKWILLGRLDDFNVEGFGFRGGFIEILVVGLIVVVGGWVERADGGIVSVGVGRLIAL